jgi:uncharacterized membrane protein
MTLESSKTLGGIGAILMFIGIFPFISYYGIVEIVGAILILISLRGLASHYRQSGIFSNALYGVIAGVVGVVIAVVAAVVTVLTSLTDLLKQIYPGWNGDWSTLQGMTPNTSNLDYSTIYPLVAGIIAVLVIVWIFAIIASFFVWRSLKQVSNNSNTGLFGTAGLLLLIGAIIPIFGLLLMWIAALLLAIAFFTMKTTEQPMVASMSPPPPPNAV